VKFLCIHCDEQMVFEDRTVPGDGTFTASFECPQCHRRIAMLANPMESQLVNSLGVKIGGRTLGPEPFELTRESVVGRADAFEDEVGDVAARRVTWSPESHERLERVPKFVRGMVKKIYSDYATEKGISEITPAVMDSVRSELGLEGI